MLVQHLGTDTSSLSPWWGREEHTMFVNVPLMTGTKVSYNSRIPASEGNTVSYVQAGGNGNMYFTLFG